MVISKDDHHTVQGKEKTKTKQQKYNCIYKYNVYTCNSNNKAITVGGEVGQCPLLFVASIPDGIAREDDNLTEIFFE